MNLVIQCNYIAGSYSGQSQAGDGRAELEWPPSPARLHQAMMSSVLSGLPASEAARYAPHIETLKWLETIPAPTIEATPIERHNLGAQKPEPQNGRSAKQNYQISLVPIKTAFPLNGGDLIVKYVWDVADDEALNSHLDTLADTVARIAYLGRGEDRVCCTVSTSTEHDASLDTWKPSNWPEQFLSTPTPHSTQKLLDRFARTKDPRVPRGTVQPAARSCFRTIGYSRPCASAQVPVHVSLFQIIPPRGTTVTTDIFSPQVLRSPIRNIAMGLALQEERWDDPVMAAELISGHMAPKNGVHDTPSLPEPHLAIVPLPSLNRAGTADGLIRRVALLGYSAPEKQEVARDIYTRLAQGMDGHLIDEKHIPRGSVLRLMENSPDNDAVWPLYASQSRPWASITPIAIVDKFRLPKRADGQPLTSSERHLARLNAWEKIVRKKMAQCGLPEHLIETCKITLSGTPMLRQGAHVSRLRTPNSNATLINAHFEFAEAIRGPLLVGDSRYYGGGLFVPTHSI